MQKRGSGAERLALVLPTYLAVYDALRRMSKRKVLSHVLSGIVSTAKRASPGCRAHTSVSSSALYQRELAMGAFVRLAGAAAQEQATALVALADHLVPYTPVCQVCFVRVLLLARTAIHDAVPASDAAHFGPYQEVIR